MITDMANQLPRTHTTHGRRERPHRPILQAHRREIPPLVDEPVSVHVEGVSGTPEGVDIPYGGIVDADFEGGIVGIDTAVESPKEGCGRGREPIGRYQVGVLRTPDGFVAVALAEAEGRERGCGGVGHAVALRVDSGHEGVGFVEIAVEQGEFAMGGHGGVHSAAGVDDRRADETRVEIFLHGDEGVIGPHVARVVSGRRGAVVDEPLVDGTSGRRDVVADGRVLLPSGCRVIGVQGAFVGLAVGQAHGVHRSIVLRQTVVEEDFDHVADFRSQGRPLQAVSSRLDGSRGEGGVGVSHVHCLLPHQA